MPPLTALLALALALTASAAPPDGRQAHLLLLSNTQNDGAGPLDHAMGAIRAWRGDVDTIAVVPFASKERDRDATVERFRKRFAPEGVKVVGVTADARGAETLRTARAIFVTGGNTFRLLDALQRANLLEPLRRRVLGGVPYLGASAGAVIAAPTIKTTNDMPITSPSGFDALGVLPFQINVHFFDPIEGMPGETRETRLLEYLEENDAPVLALRQGGWIAVEGGSVSLGGAGARVFRKGDKPYDKAKPQENKPRELAPGAKLDLELNPER